MAKLFEEDGIRFQYPENWELQREDTQSGWTVSLQSPDTAFLMVSYDPDMPEPELMSRTALEALEGEYTNLESEECIESVAGQPAVGHDVRFFSFDLTNTCWIRSFHGGGGTLLVLWQANDLELERSEPILKAICSSLKVEEE
ncbi:MAG: hypothetical protein L0Y72_25475 [Gemmataceae bacterium]|nr:hypothetical protein [Gemmataceae bacterium]MCI0742397.1 hypothetical protein [Gemmataceae bacterium]